jgi:hypothetical protein
MRQNGMNFILPEVCYPGRPRRHHLLHLKLSVKGCSVVGKDVGNVISGDIGREPGTNYNNYFK